MKPQEIDRTHQWHINIPTFSHEEWLSGIAAEDVCNLLCIGSIYWAEHMALPLWLAQPTQLSDKSPWARCLQASTQLEISCQ